jgi:hypothetical protein
LQEAATPRGTLQRDRDVFLSSFLGLGLAVGIITGVSMALSPKVELGVTVGVPNGVGVGIGVGVANWIAVALAVGFSRALWGNYRVSWMWFVRRGDLPRHLMEFLEDAHLSRGVLRQIGGQYQFRHVELQRRLASDKHMRPSAIQSSLPERNSPDAR